MMGIGKPQPHANFKVASICRCRNIVRNSKAFGKFPSEKATLFLWVRFYDGPWQAQTVCIKFEVASFSRCVNIEEKLPNFWELA